MLLLWFILIVIVRQLSVCIRRFANFAGHLLGKSCPLGFPLVLFYLVFMFLSRLMSWAKNWFDCIHSDHCSFSYSGGRWENGWKWALLFPWLSLTMSLVWDLKKRFSVVLKCCSVGLRFCIGVLCQMYFNCSLNTSSPSDAPRQSLSNVRLERKNVSYTHFVPGICLVMAGLSRSCHLSLCSTQVDFPWIVHFSCY